MTARPSNLLTPSHATTALGRAARLTIACAVLTAAGCNAVATQTKNAEGVRLYQQGDYQQASLRFQEAIARTPENADGYYNLAASMHKIGALYNRPDDLRQAEVLYNQCLERDPNHTDCYRGLAVLLTETDRRDAAFRLLNNWNAASTGNPNPDIELARLLEESGESEQATAQLIEALSVDPNNARAFAALARLRDQAGNHAQALADYQRSLDLNRFQPQVAARVASLQASLGAAGASATPVSPPTRLSQTWRSAQPTVRY